MLTILNLLRIWYPNYVPHLTDNKNLNSIDFSGTDANICPEGYYCPVGTTNPVPCPKGMYSNSTGLQAELDCVLCPAGSYCEQTAMTAPSGLCDAG